MNKQFYFFQFFIAMILVIGCKKDDEPDDKPLQPYHLFTFSLESNYLRPGDSAAFFVSDMEGNLIAQAMAKENKNVEFFLPPETYHPKRLMVSWLKYPSESKRMRFIIYTYMDVEPATWILRGSSLTDSLGHAAIEFHNSPYLSQGSNLPGILSTYNSSRLYSSQIPEYYNFNMRINPDIVYVKMNTVDNGMMYYIVPEINNGDHLVIDLSDSKPLAEKTITLPEVFNNYYCNIYGLTDGQSPGRYLVERAHETSGYANEFTVYYPTGIFSDFQSSIRIQDNSHSNIDWYQNTYGSIPDQFSKFNASVEITKYNPENFQYTFSGEGALISPSFYWSDNINDTLFQFPWYVYMPVNVTSFSLPELPLDFHQSLPSLVDVSYEFNSLVVYDYVYYNDYKEILKYRFEQLDELPEKYDVRYCIIHATNKSVSIPDDHNHHFYSTDIPCSY